MRLANQTGHRVRKVRTGREGRMASATNHVRGDGQTDGDKTRETRDTVRSRSASRTSLKMMLAREQSDRRHRHREIETKGEKGEGEPTERKREC